MSRTTISKLIKKNGIYDVIRYEVSGSLNAVDCRLLFFPESKTTKEIFLRDYLLQEKGVKMKLSANSSMEMSEIMREYKKEALSISETWFEENRPEVKSKSENMGIYYDTNIE